ncbi:flagellar hook-length control protein FliK [Enterococcus gallinarum]|uniref:flagellar hook-length control protein FliK n=1 Tax=Enterococcus gallinarum TaxID=1353 RepID=UPI001D178170|nr:flagellar hook-length control protein FliK [Enterococcus gallinarum]MCC4045945.1 flagellar hook-length control protein FliK [Enterococcus gallinarum]
MKQVAITPALMKVADKQQPAAVKDPGNFIQFLQQFSQNLEGNSANEDGVPQGDLSCVEQGNQLADNKEDESVADSENATDTRIPEANSEMTKQAEIVNEGALGWLGFFGSQMTESKGSVLGDYPLQLPKEDPLVVDSASEQSGTSVATDQVFQSTGGNPLEDTASESTLSKSDTPVAAILPVGELTTDGEKIRLDSGTESISQTDAPVDTKGNTNSEKTLLVDEPSKGSAQSFIPQQALERVAISESSTIDDSMKPIDGSNGLQQTTTLDLSKLLMQNDQRPTPAAVKTVVEPLTQKIEQLVQTPEKKITLQLVPEKLGKVRIALEVTAQGSRLEFTVEQQQTKHLLSSIKTELEQVLQKQENQLISGKEGILKENPATAVERAALTGSLASFTSTTDGQTAQQGFSQPQRQSGKKSYNQVPLPKEEETTEQTNHAISILA